MEWFRSRTFFDGQWQASQAIWMDLALARRSGQELRNAYIITKSLEHAPLRRFFRAAVDQLQMLFDASVVTSVQPQSLITQMRAAVADCDDASSDGSLMLLSPPRDIPDAALPAGSEMDIGTRDADSPVVMTVRTVCVGVRSPSDSTDGDIQTFILIYITTESNFYRFWSYFCMYNISGFICSGFICSDRTSGLVYLESNHFVTHLSSDLHFRTYVSFIESGYSYYVNML